MDRCASGIRCAFFHQTPTRVVGYSGRLTGFVEKDALEYWRASRGTDSLKVRRVRERRWPRYCRRSAVECVSVHSLLLPDHSEIQTQATSETPTYEVRSSSLRIQRRTTMTYTRMCVRIGIYVCGQALVNVWNTTRALILYSRWGFANLPISRLATNEVWSLSGYKKKSR